MSKELKEIIEKIVSENPDILFIYTNWRPGGFGGMFVAQTNDLVEPRSADFTLKYSQFIWDNYESELDDFVTVVVLQRVGYIGDPAYNLVYDKNNGGILNE